MPGPARGHRQVFLFLDAALPCVMTALCAELGTASRALFLTSRPLAGRTCSRQHITTRWARLRERGGPIVDESEQALTTLKLGAWNRQVELDTLHFFNSH